MFRYSRCVTWSSRAWYQPSWNAKSVRTFGTTPSEPPWFLDLRDQMLSRELPLIANRLENSQRYVLEDSITRYMEPTNVYPASKAFPLPLGHHLVYSNRPLSAVGPLLPDGTDLLHSPGGPFVRRMWAGGSIHMDKDRYWDRVNGIYMGETMACVERITDVQLRGTEKSAKIVVTVERRLANSKVIDESPLISQSSQLEARAALVEERQLIFLKEHTSEELVKLKQSMHDPVRFLRSPAKPDLSHHFTPSVELLRAYSVMTENAHLIHLNRSYVQDVEGHRALLVHGPLLVNLLLALVNNHLFTAFNEPLTAVSMSYRNIAPLYCDEPLRLCAKQKKSQSDAQTPTYDVWVEGPTGGMAVKGTLSTATITPHQGRLQDVV